MNISRNRVTALLGCGLTAEILSAFSVVAALIALRIYPAISLLGMALSIMAFVPLIAYGRDKYCITGLLIFVLSAIGFIGSAIVGLIQIAGYVRS